MLNLNDYYQTNTSDTEKNWSEIKRNVSDKFKNCRFFSKKLEFKTLDLQNFLDVCLKKTPEERPDALKLLKYEFILGK